VTLFMGMVASFLVGLLLGLLLVDTLLPERPMHGYWIRDHIDSAGNDWRGCKILQPVSKWEYWKHVRHHKNDGFWCSAWVSCGIHLP
jgi:hypothetical protein